MKISGSHTEQIDSPSINILRIKEQAVITATTELLSKDGKHVINIIHGTPSTLMGSVYKSITFLWEADDESPEYLQAQEIKRQEQERKQQELRQKELAEKFHLQKTEKEESISKLKRRIENAEHGRIKMNGFNTIVCVFDAIMIPVCAVLGFIAIIDLEEYLLGLFCLCMVILLPCAIMPSIKKRKEAKKRMEEDRQNLDELRCELNAKIIELNEFNKTWRT